MRGGGAVKGGHRGSQARATQGLRPPKVCTLQGGELPLQDTSTPLQKTTGFYQSNPRDTRMDYSTRIKRKQQLTRLRGQGGPESQGDRVGTKVGHYNWRMRTLGFSDSFREPGLDTQIFHWIPPPSDLQNGGQNPLRIIWTRTDPHQKQKP